jgi:hypothetical protein
MEIKNRRKLYATLERSLSEREQRVQKLETQAKIPVTAEDLGYIFEDLNMGRSTLPPQVVLVKPQAVRWEMGRDLTDDNIVIMGHKEAARHEKECLIGGKSVDEVWGQEAVEWVKRRGDEARRVAVYRRG